MVSLSDAELNYRNGEWCLGRLPPADAVVGSPHVVASDVALQLPARTIDIAGAEFASSRKFRKSSRPHGGVRRGRPGVDRPKATPICHGSGVGRGDRRGRPPLVRIFTDTIVSWGLEPAAALTTRP